jgi:hypothetical protein
MDSKHRELAAQEEHPGVGLRAGASSRLESSGTQMMRVDLRSRISGGGRSAFCMPRDARTPVEKVSPDRSSREATISLDDDVES